MLLNALMIVAVSIVLSIQEDVQASPSKDSTEKKNVADEFIDAQENNLPPIPGLEEVIIDEELTSYFDNVFANEPSDDLGDKTIEKIPPVPGSEEVTDEELKSFFDNVFANEPSDDLGDETIEKIPPVPGSEEVTDEELKSFFDNVFANEPSEDLGDEAIDRIPGSEHSIFPQTNENEHYKMASSTLDNDESTTGTEEITEEEIKSYLNYAFESDSSELSGEEMSDNISASKYLDNGNDENHKVKKRMRESDDELISNKKQKISSMQRKRFSKETIDVLNSLPMNAKGVLLDPIVSQTGLTRKQISNWLSQKRKKLGQRSSRSYSKFADETLVILNSLPLNAKGSLIDPSVSQTGLIRQQITDYLSYKRKKLIQQPPPNQQPKDS